MPFACDATERHPMQEHLEDVETSSIAFCMRCSPNVWLTNLTEENEELRLHGLCLCYLPPMGFLHPPSPARLSDALARVTAFSNSCAGVLPGFFCSDSFMCTFFYSVNFPVSILSFYISSWFVSVCCAAFSLSRSALSSPLSCTWLLQASSFLHQFHYYRTVERFIYSIFKDVKAKDENERRRRLLWSFVQKHLLKQLCFRSSFNQREHPGSFDMRAPIPLNVVPHLTQSIL